MLPSGTRLKRQGGSDHLSVAVVGDDMKRGTVFASAATTYRANVLK